MTFIQPAMAHEEEVTKSIQPAKVDEGAKGDEDECVIAGGDRTFQGMRCDVEDILHQLIEGGAHKGRVASKALVQDASKAPEVGCHGVRTALLEKLWSHVRW